jgi:hypothetical protein
MTRDQAFKDAMAAYAELERPGTLSEIPFGIIEESLGEHPELVDSFIDLFEQEKGRGNKETLAMIILSVRSYEPARRFLKDEMRWTDEDFQGFR